MVRTVALVPAAGQGTRMGSERPKAFLPLGGIPILAYTLQKFEACPGVEEILPVVPAGSGVLWTEQIVREWGMKKVSRIVPGGAERQESVHLGLKALQGKADWVIIHDGVRPFVSPDLIERSLAETGRWQAVVAALPAQETLKEVSPEKEVLKTVNRRHLWIIQTPQVFAFDLILRAHEEARREGFAATDDSLLVERLGVPVRIIEGSKLNLKITTPEDLVLGEGLLKHLEKR